MNNESITFEFDTRKAALLAMDTLEEIGYETVLHEEAQRTLLHVSVERSDLTSALEIAEAHGGRVVENASFPSEPAVFALAYDPDGGIPIPAHLVGEDEIKRASSSSGAGSAGAAEEKDAFDPSGEDYNGFNAGIHM